MKSSDIIAVVIIAAVIIITCFFVHERNMENQSLIDTVRAEVKAEMDRRYRNVPRIQVEKVYTLHATGKDIAIETEGGG